MAPPVFTYPWRFKANQDLNTTGTLIGDYQQLLLAIKNSLITAAGWTDLTGAASTLTTPWTVVASSNGVGANASDNWALPADLVWAAAPTAHSWIVLRQTGINGLNAELCLDLSNATVSILTIVHSFGAGFDVSSPTVNNRPTATDEYVRSNQTWLGPSATFNSILNVSVSDGGECTRIFVFINLLCQAFWSFDKPQNPVSGWTNPAVFTIQNAAEPLYASINTSSLGAMRAKNWKTGIYKNSAAVWTTENYNNNGIGRSQTVANTLTGEWMMAKVGVAVPPTGTAGLYGYHGGLSDVWFGSGGAGTSTPRSGDTYRDSTLTFNYQYIQVGDLILPWDRSLLPVVT